jgi:subfamily B ATP-binding cassette protein MsbA
LAAQQRMGDLNSRLIETLQGIRIIKAFTAETREAGRFAVINQEYYKANIRTVKRREVLAGIIELMGMVGGLLVLEVGGSAVLHGQLSPGTVIFFLAALLSLYEPIKKLSRLHSVNQQAVVAARRLVEILETQPSVQELPNAPDAPSFSRTIEYRQVGFRYEKSDLSQERQVLRGIQLTVQAGEMVAIIGSSGAGKTTLVNLLLRFYDPTEGQILLDGRDTKTVSLHSLRRQIGLVTQDPFLFHDSIRANIAFGKPDASLDEIVAAAKAANADDFIRTLPNGYDTAVGDLGSKLSGGERQRIAIARALLKNPPILILDEATSQLDSESERLVQQALERLLKGRTALVIAHRFSTIRSASRILVLERGTIADSGTHDQLIHRSALYKKLYELQVAFE